jgi:uncharacterized protein YbjT (DUF2867 family)
MMYLVTGATGEIGSRVVECLLRSDKRVRVFARNVEKARLRFGNRVEIFSGDLADPGSLRPALEQVDGLFLVSTGPEIPRYDRSAARVAKAAGVGRLVKLSSMDVEQGIALRRWHEQGEDGVRAADIPFIFVRPSGFMSNLLAWAPPIQREGVLRSSTGGGRRALIHPIDIAEVSVAALTTGGYLGKCLTITGPEALTYAEIAEKIGVATGKHLTYQQISDDEAQAWYRATGASDSETEAHVALWRAIRDGRLAMVTGTVEQVLGRKPLAIAQWIAENAAAFC